MLDRKDNNVNQTAGSRVPSFKQEIFICRLGIWKSFKHGLLVKHLRVPINIFNTIVTEVQLKRGHHLQKHSYLFLFLQ